MKKPYLYLLLAMLAALFQATALAQDEEEECELEEDTRLFSSNFSTTDCKFRNRHRSFEVENSYFILEPGWQVVLEGEDDDEFIRVETTVLNETEWVEGVLTRVVEEREWIDGELFEVSRNFFAICEHTNDIYYFGEDVDFYEDGEIVDHHGAWRVGVNGAKPGILMPGRVLMGARFHQEYSLGEAEDRAEVLGMTTLEIDGEVYENVLMIQEGSPLDSPCDAEIKFYAPGIGNIIDEELEIVESGFVFRIPQSLSFKDN